MNLFIAYVSILVTCPLLFTTIHFFTLFLRLFLKTKSPFPSSLLRLLATTFNIVSRSFFPWSKERLEEEEEEEAEESRGRSLGSVWGLWFGGGSILKYTFCASNEPLISTNDALVAMRRLGLWRGDECCKEVGGLEEAYKLLEDKEASMEELEEAFAVFDEDGDGVISADELRNVLKRLGFSEGIGLGECERMIGSHDLDGDGRFGFKDFKSLLERAA